jgi:hypothetical protein
MVYMIWPQTFGNGQVEEYLRSTSPEVGGGQVSRWSGRLVELHCVDMERFGMGWGGAGESAVLAGACMYGGWMHSWTHWWAR